MRPLKPCVTVVFVLIVLFTGTAASEVNAASVQESVPGGGGFIVPANGAHIRYTVNAVRHRDGRVTGQFELHAETATGEFLARTHVRITCFTITGNIARIGGIVFRSNINPPGTPGFITVVDNGEGNDAPADLLSLPATGPGTDIEHCDTGLPRELFPIETGNVQIRPSGL